MKNFFKVATTGLGGMLLKGFLAIILIYITAEILNKYFTKKQEQEDQDALKKVFGDDKSKK